MTQMANVVLKDYAGTDHTFVPQGLTSGVATFANSAGVPIGNKTVSYSTKQTQSGKWKVTLKGVFPIVQDVEVSGVSKPTAVRVAYVNMDFTFDATSSTAERQDVRAYMKNFLAEAQIVAAIEDLSTPF